MIPLNKPHKGIIEIANIVSNNSFDDFLKNSFSNYHLYWTYSARNGLDIVYKYLFQKFGVLKVGVSPLTCFDALYPIISNHHKIVFIDIDPDSLNLDETLLLDSDEKLEVIQPIHLGGNPQKMDIITKWAKKRNVIIIEDCAQSLGSYFNNQHVGSFGDFSVFSLVKNLHSVYGAILFSKYRLNIQSNEIVPGHLQLYKTIKKYLESNSSYKPNNLNNFLYKQILQLKEGGKSYLTPKNYFLSDKFISNQKQFFVYHKSLNEIRLNITERIIDALNPNLFTIQKTPNGGFSNRNRLLIKSKKQPAKELIYYLRKQGIAANNLTQNYLNGYQEHITKDRVLNKHMNINALKNYNLVFPKIFSLPNSPGLNQSEIEYIIEKINYNN